MALRSAKEKLEYVMASNPAVIYSSKPLPDLSDWVLVYVSDRVTSLLGYRPDEFVGNLDFWRKHVHPDDLQACSKVVHELWESGHHTFDYRFLHKDGSYRWIREEAGVVRGIDGKPLEVNGYWTDITTLKELEQRFEKSRTLTGPVGGHPRAEETR